MEEVDNETLDILISELTPEEQERFKVMASNKKRGNKQMYNSNLKKAMQNLLDMGITTIDGIDITLADKAAMAAIKEYFEKPSVDKYKTLMQTTGEYSEKVEAKVSDFDKVMSTLKGDDY